MKEESFTTIANISNANIKHLRNSWMLALITNTKNRGDRVVRLTAQVWSSSHSAPLIPSVVTLNSFRFASAEACVRLHLDNLRYIHTNGDMSELGFSSSCHMFCFQLV